MAYTILQNLAPLKAHGARPGIKMTKIDGVTIHMTDNWRPGADAKAHGDCLRNGGSTQEASWHYCVDDKYAVQSIPDIEIAHHSGNTIGNTTTIAIEICVNPESNLTIACDNAAHLAAYLLRKYGLTVNKLYKHQDWSGKYCPSMILDGKPYTWEEFKSKVKKAYGKNEIPNKMDYITKHDSSLGVIGVGSIVDFDGKSYCYTASNGGRAGVIPPAGKYEITYYKPGVMYPIHIGNYGWVPATNCGLVKLNNNELSKPSTENIKVGDTVRFDGTVHCHASSEGKGTGMIPPAGDYIVTHYNPDSKYPIHIGTYGWVSLESCGVTSVGEIKVGSTVYFDGKVHCYTSSSGGRSGVIPPAGNYEVTYYNPNGKYPIHIGTYGWVSNRHCKLI